MKKTEVKKPKSTPEKTPSKPLSPWKRLLIVLKLPFIRIQHAVRNFQSRRPHRSFRLTRRRDYKRSLKLPGYWAFTFYVLSILRRNWRMFLLVVLLYAAFGLLFGMMTSLDMYRQMGDLLEKGIDGVLEGSWATITQAGILSVTVFLGDTSQLTDTQKIYVGIMILMTWLTTVWLLREILTGRRPRVREGLYSAGAPIMSTLLLVVYFLIQLLPIGLLALIYTALAATGLITSGFPLFLFMTIAALVIALTLYWVTATFIAMVIITLPGMYPSYALRAAGDMVVGRRLRVLFRLLWMILMVAIVWLLVMIPLVIFDTWLANTYEWGWLDWLPVVPIVSLVLSAASTVWIASYIYLLYRKVVDDDAAPA